MKFTHCPKLYEVLEDCGCDEKTVDQRVGQEQDEVFVVGEAHAIVHPESTFHHLFRRTIQQWQIYYGLEAGQRTRPTVKQCHCNASTLGETEI